MNEKFSTDKAPAPVGLYPHARRAGQLLFLSGIGPREAGTNKIPGLEFDSLGNSKLKRIIPFKIINELIDDTDNRTIYVENLP